MEDTFNYFNGRAILELFTLTVFSDPSLFDGADTPTIRAHFRQWAESAFRTEQQPQDNSGDVEVDAAALHSVLHDAPAPPALDATKKGWVKLINKSWIPIEEDPRARPNPTVYEPIEGVMEPDVGGMKCPYQCVMTEYYSGNEGMNGWRTEYCRPPKVVGPPYGE